MSKRSVLLIAILVILAIGGVVGYKMWNKPFKDPLEGDAIKVAAVQLFNDFSTNEAVAQKKYVPEKLGDKKVEVTGQITDIGKNDDGETFYTLKTSDEMFGVSICNWSGPIPSRGEMIPPNTWYRPLYCCVLSIAITSRIFSTTHIISCLRETFAQMLHNSLSAILWQREQNLISSLII